MNLQLTDQSWWTHHYPVRGSETRSPLLNSVLTIRDFTNLGEGMTSFFKTCPICDKVLVAEDRYPPSCTYLQSNGATHACRSLSSIDSALIDIVSRYDHLKAHWETHILDRSYQARLFWVVTIAISRTSYPFSPNSSSQCEYLEEFGTFWEFRRRIHNYWWSSETYPQV